VEVPGASVEPDGVLADRPVDRPRARARLPGVDLAADKWPTSALVALARALAVYHRHQVLHLDRLLRVLRARRRVVLVGNHALDVVDPLLFVVAVLARYGRVPRFIAHRSWQRLPVLRAMAARYGIVPSRSMEDAGRALADDGFLMLFPGGVSEAALRSYRNEPYRLKWDDRLGFLRLALEHDAEIVFVAAVGNDDMYYQSHLPTPSAVVRVADAGDGKRYRGAYLRFGLAGVHLLPGVFPLPVQLTHVVSRPLDLGDRAAARRDPDALVELHRSVWQRCQTFLDEAVARRDRTADTLDRAVRTGQHLLHRIGLV